MFGIYIYIMPTLTPPSHPNVGKYDSCLVGGLAGSDFVQSVSSLERESPFSSLQGTVAIGMLPNARPATF